ncbi:MAG: hypothetical protein QM601_08965 [Pseudoxanthomonas sp.]
MTTRTGLLLIAALALVACQPASRQADAPPAALPATTTAATDTPRQGASPRPAPDAATAADAEAACQVVLAYYRAINAGDFARAYAQWSRDGQASGQSFEQFRNGYAATREVRAEVGVAHDLQGAAGSRYIEVPVRLAARQADGSVRRYHGDFVLRAVVADGAGDAQRRWHLDSAELQRDR